MDKVIVGMSGGIDSSVAALLLKEKGYDVIGITLKHLPDELSENQGKTCCSLDDITDAKAACSQIGIPHYTIDVTSEFKKEVIDYFIDTYNKGKTPSPCVVCDEKIKIKKLVELADKMGAKYISTGHYSSKNVKSNLVWNPDNKKDQTYMLYRIDSKTFERFLFPLEGYEKVEVRKLAKEKGIQTYAKPDSQGICFAPNGYIDFLKKYLNKEIKKGNYINKNGEKIGTHGGYQLYTIGQRKGLGLNNGKINFITRIDSKNNEVVVGDFEDLLIDKVEIINYIFHEDITKYEDKNLIARPRFSSKGLCGKLITEENKVYFIFDNKNAESSPGQHIVIYHERELIGGGEIKFVNEE